MIRVLHVAGPAEAARRLAFHGVPAPDVAAMVADLRTYLLSVSRGAGDIEGLPADLDRAGIPWCRGDRAFFLSVSSSVPLRKRAAAGGPIGALWEEACRAVDDFTRETFVVPCRDRILPLAAGHPRLMGVLNVTPDSFSDGGRFADPGEAVRRGIAMVAAGADIIDVGGESTRPGSRSVTAAQELERVIPVIRELADRSDALLSVDTTKSVVAREAAAAGARIINDTSAMGDDPGMPAVVRETGCAVVLMHRKGTPATMQTSPYYESLMDELVEDLAGRIAAAEAAGVSGDRILVDPGVGFGKRPEDNLALHRNLPDLRTLGRPVVFGSSRKSFLGPITGKGPADRLLGSAASASWAAMSGAHVLRVHDVAEMKDVAAVLSAIAGGPEC